MEEAIRGLMLGASAIESMLDHRVDWGLRQQGAPLPAITLHRISSVPQMNMAAASGWERTRIQVDCWGATYIAARDLATLIAGDGGLLVGFRGDHMGVRLRTMIVGRRSEMDTDNKGPVHRTSVDAMVWHRPIS